MKIAVMSDIHGFSLALDAVLADISPEGVDELIVAGDLCEVGPDPRGVLERIEKVGARALQGNTDRDLANGDRMSTAARYTIDLLGDDGIRYLRDLPFEIRIPGPGGSSPDDDLLVVHANPYDQNLALSPDLDERDVLEILGDTRFRVLAFGHIHIAYIRQVGDRTLVDVSAVGNPKDGDLRSKWGLFTWNESTRTWSVELRYVDYPLSATIDQIHASDLPNPDKVVEKLMKAGY